MSNKIYVGNIPWKTNESELSEFFSTVGKVLSASIVKDKETGKSRGFGFIEMESEKAAQDAIDVLNNDIFMDRPLIVKAAIEKERKPFERKRPAEDISNRYRS